jgi:Flp pilus assembly protein TadG
MRSFSQDRAGVAAVEFAIVGGLLAASLVGVLEVWTMGSRMSQMRSGVEAGVQYVMAGGRSDAEAQAVSLAAWSNRPKDGAVDASRECRCGEVVKACSATCTGDAAPAVYLRLQASTKGGSLFAERVIQHQQTVRVR